MTGNAVNWQAAERAQTRRVGSALAGGGQSEHCTRVQHDRAQGRQVPLDCHAPTEHASNQVTQAVSSPQRVLSWPQQPRLVQAGQAYGSATPGPTPLARGQSRTAGQERGALPLTPRLPVVDARRLGRYSAWRSSSSNGWTSGSRNACAPAARSIWRARPVVPSDLVSIMSNTAVLASGNSIHSAWSSS